MKGQDVIKEFYDYYKEFSYEELEIKFLFTIEGSYDINIFYINNNNKKETNLDGRELFKYERYIQVA